MTKFILGGASALALMAGAALAQQSDITVGIQLEPPNLDPTGGAAQAIDSVLYGNVFEGLTRFMADGSVVPALAKDWTITEDGLVYTFMLNEGVTFHDGTTMDAEDVKFSLDRARAEDSTNAQKGLFADIASVEVIDPMTVQVTLAQPNGSFLFNMAWGDAVIVAPESIADIASNPIGTGPYKFDTWVQGDRLEMSAYEGYWGEQPAISNATFRFISDPTAAFAAVMAEDVDAFVGFPAPENLPQFEADPRFQVLTGNTEGETILSTNNADEVLSDLRVRQAIAHAIDRQAIIDGAMFGYGTPIGSHFAPHNPDYVDLTGMSAYDPDKARELLAEAGHAEGLTLSLKLPPPSYARRGGEIIAAQLAEVGITAEISNLEWAQWIEEVFTNKDYDLSIVSHTEPMDIGIYANPDYYFQYDNPEFQALMTTLTETTDPAARSEILKQAQEMIAADAVNGFLFELAVSTVAKAGLQGLWVDQPTAAVMLSEVSWAE